MNIEKINNFQAGDLIMQHALTANFCFVCTNCHKNVIKCNKNRLLRKVSI